MQIKPQNQFPLLERYKEKFAIDENTIFAYDNAIYSNNPLPKHLIVHEKVHIRRQNKLGVDTWCEQFINDRQFRLKEEILAYKEQIQSIKNREERHKVKWISAKNLSSELYGNIISFEEALKQIG